MSRARTGEISLCGGRILAKTPLFMPVGTSASIKGVSSENVDEMGYPIILGNTYHLSLRPGSEKIRGLGGLKKFMGWPNAILTDSGGYQVFSLAKRMVFQEDGVEFRSHIDGAKHFLSPSRVIEIQADLGSDIMMVLDDCPPANPSTERLKESLRRTHLWALSSIRHFDILREKKRITEQQKIFAILQGGLSEEMRSDSLSLLQEATPSFDGIAIGGLSVGEKRKDMYKMLDFLGPKLDTHSPHYLMGVGAVPDILEGVKNGMDMFDCVLPTRNGRNGQAFTSEGVIRIRNQCFQNSDAPLDPACDCKACQKLSRAYLRHLFMAGEMLGPMMLSLHNLHFYSSLMRGIHQSIQEGRFAAFYKKWNQVYQEQEER